MTEAIDLPRPSEFVGLSNETPRAIGGQDARRVFRLDADHAHRPRTLESEASQATLTKCVAIFGTMPPRASTAQRPHGKERSAER